MLLDDLPQGTEHVLGHGAVSTHVEVAALQHDLTVNVHALRPDQILHVRLQKHTSVSPIILRTFDDRIVARLKMSSEFIQVYRSFSHER